MTEPKRPLRVGVWCAVSSQAQASEDKVSLEEQERQGREFAAAIDGEVVAVYRVPGHTRDIVFFTDAEKQMLAYRDLHEDLKSSSLDVLWGYDVDRLGRDPALGQQVISLVEKNDAEVYLQSAPHVIGQKTVGHRYITAIQSVRAGEDQALRVHRLKMGLRGRVKRGLIPTRPPLGYSPVRDEVTGRSISYQFNEKIAAVDLMTKLFLEGHSYTEIRRRLNASPYTASNGGDWNYAQVRHVLHNDAYAGLPRWGTVQADKPSDRYPARWDEDTHAAIVRERRRRAKSSYHRRGAGPLSGVAFCARCGSGMSRAKPHGTYYLRCNKHARRSITGETCHGNNIKEEKVIQEVGRFLQLLNSPEAIDAALAELAPGGDIGAEMEAMQRETASIEKKRRRLALALADGKMDASMYRATDDLLLDQLERAKAQTRELSRQLEAQPDLSEMRTTLEDLVSSFQNMVTEAEPAEISAALQRSGIKALVEENEVLAVLIDTT